MKKFQKIICFILTFAWLFSSVQATTLESKTAIQSQAIFTKDQILNTTKLVIDVVGAEYIHPESVDSVSKDLNHLITMHASRYVNNRSRYIKEVGEVLRRSANDGYIELLTNDTDFAIGGGLTFKYQQLKTNYGFEEAKILDGNIGYLKINHFFDNKEAEVVAQEALAVLKNTNAMIIDLREANEGSMEFAQHLMSYFIDTETLLAEIHYQRQEKTLKLESIEGLGYANFKQNYPIYILTSAFVTHAAEFFSYTLQHFDRAAIIGRKTMGVSSLSQEFVINEWLTLKLPVALPINPITKSNWEGEGVIPDIDVDTKRSFETAYQHARNLIR